MNNLRRGERKEFEESDRKGQVTMERLSQLQAFHELFGCGGDSSTWIGGKFAALGRIFVAEYDPQAGAIGLVVAGADGAGELGKFEARAAQKFGEDAACVIDEVAKTLGDKNGVHIARGGLFKLVEIVIG